MKLREVSSPTVQRFNILPETTCEILIELFENNKDNTEYLNKSHKPCFTQLNVNEYASHVVKPLVDFTRQAYDEYCKPFKYLPEFKYVEQFRIKRYLPGGEERFDEHVDVTSYDTSVRALAFLFYLNENDGQTVFPNHNLRFTPRTGDVIVFPPTWEYPHAGLPPTDNTKYILSTYLHYG